MDIRAIGMGLAFAFMWSSAFTSARIIVADASPLWALALRFLISGAIAVGIASALGETWRLTRAQWGLTVVFGICQNALYLGMNFVAMQTVEASLASIIASILPLLVALAFLMYADRKIWAAVQMRRGPNVVGAWGLLQTVADALKYVVKEIVVPAGADRTVFMLAPMASFVLAMIAWAVIPFNNTWVLADLNVAILYVFAVSSLEVYGVIMGGWASNSKYPFLGSLRSAAQMISYEVSLGLIIIGVIITTGSMNFGAIVAAQDGDWGLFFVLTALMVVPSLLVLMYLRGRRPRGGGAGDGPAPADEAADDSPPLGEADPVTRG